MVTLILFLLASLGLTNILVHGKILDDDHLGWRSWLKRQLDKFWYSDVLDCYECTGFFAGMITGLCLVSYNPVYFVLCGFAAAGLMHAYVAIVEFLQSKTDYVVTDDDEQPE
jgi:hypothetical protein